MNCRIGRVLRRLEVGEIIREGDFAHPEINFSKSVHGEPLQIHSIPCFRPLTPEEVEEHKRKFNRCKCGRELNSMGYCPPCRQNSNVKYIERVRA